MEVLSHGYRFRRGHGQPFTVMGKQFCTTCKTETDKITEHRSVGNVYGTKQWCRRCGQVMAGGVYYHCPVITSIPTSTFSLAVDWMKSTEQKG